MLFVITGPSGSGKSTLVRRVLAELNDVEFSVSHTTRKKREPEVEGKDYYFVSKEEFEMMVKRDRFVEWAVVHGSYYGTSKREIAKKESEIDLLLDIDVQGARQIKQKIKKAVFIFVLPPAFQELKKRLEKRGQEDAAAIRKRLEVARKEIKQYAKFDCVIINDDLDTAVLNLKSIILSKRCRLDACRKGIAPILRSFSD